MFEAIVNRAKRSVETLVSKYVARAAVAVPFVIALGFGTASAAVKLTEDYGNMTAYGILAGSFAAVGLAAAAVVAVSNRSTPAPVVLSTDTPPAMLQAEPGTNSTLPETELLLAALGALGPAAIPGLARLLIKNLPLLIGLIVIGYLMFATTKTAEPAPSSAEL